MPSKTDDNGVIKQEDIPDLLALAAEHDRVDILQDLLQRAKTHYDQKDENNNECDTSSKSTDYDSHQRTLNFPLSSSKKPFIPPLHIAISSGSVHASTCLLRMGADPSIRPQIDSPLKIQQSEEDEEEEEKEKVEEEEDDESDDNDEEEFDLRLLRKYHNLSAYELLQHSNLSMGKKKGIEHAFFAEALRCIGSDDADRLECLLRSGMRSGNESKYRNQKEGEKTLYDWAKDMVEDEPHHKCLSLLKTWKNDDVYHDTQTTKDVQNKIQNETTISAETNNDMAAIGDVTLQKYSPVKGKQAPIDSPGQIQIKSLQRKIEESQSLAASLAPILEDIMQETSICQTLIIGPSPNDNVSPLITYVKTMKAAKAQKEIELEQYQYLLERASLEEDRLERIFKNEYNNLSSEERCEWDAMVEKEVLDQKGTYFCDNPTNMTTEEEQHIINTLISKLEEFENRVNTLRASLVDMSEENSRVLSDIKRLGLSGAARLAKTLREELAEYERSVKEAKVQGESCQTRVQQWKLKIKRLRGEEKEPIITEDSNRNQKEDRNSETPQNEIGDNHDEHEEYEDEDEEEEEEDEYEEYSTSSGEYEEYSDDEEEEEHDADEIPSSTKIARGKSNSIMLRQNSRFSLELWDLICRIVGISKNAVKETKKKAVTIGRNSSGVMIV